MNKTLLKFFQEKNQIHITHNFHQQQKSRQSISKSIKNSLKIKNEIYDHFKLSNVIQFSSIMSICLKIQNHYVYVY